MLNSKQLTESVSPPRKLDNSSNSLKKEVSPKINKSQIDSCKIVQPKKNNMIKSEVIIENARNRIDDLSKQ